jgi:hypothetical protein
MKRISLVLILGIILGIAGTEGMHYASRLRYQPKPPPPQAQQQLDDLEARTKALEDRYQQAGAFKDTDYLLRIQKQYEAYYEKAFNSQTTMLWIYGSLIAFVVGLASLFGLGMFDKKIELAIQEANNAQESKFEMRLGQLTENLRSTNALSVKDATATQEKEFEQRIREEVLRLQGENEKSLSKMEVDLKQQISYNSEFVQGIAFLGLSQFNEAKASFRNAIDIYRRNPQGPLAAPSAVASINNLFASLHRENPDKFTEKALEELADPRFATLQPELDLAAAEYEPLADARSKITSKRQAPNPSASGEAQPTPDAEHK